MFKLLIATNNKHKIDEFRKLLTDIDDELELVTPDDVGGIEDVVEDGTTFEENACKKALSASNAHEIASVADDSGLVVEALNGEPGLYSSRYAGEGASSEECVTKLLKNLEGCENRKAKFVCVIAIANDEDILATFEGEVHGTIAKEPKGEGGFGYDPVFIPEGFDKTFAELGSEIKDKISHRARAVQKAIEFCEDMADMEM